MRLYEINATFRPRRIYHFILLRINGSKFYFHFGKMGNVFIFPFLWVETMDNRELIDIESMAIFSRNRSILS